MAAPNELYGSCACERNQYTILIPSSSQARSQAEVFFDNSRANRRFQATPLTAWLRVPLAWYHSATYAHFPDESHAHIRRTFSTNARGDEAARRRQFCGFCGTHLTSSSQDEVQQEEEEYMDVTLGSLLSESLDLLEQLEMLSTAESSSSEEGEEDETQTSAALQPRATAQVGSVRNRGMPYFEELVQHSALGRVKRRKGGHTSRDGRTTVEWEVVEVDEGGDEVMGEDVMGHGHKRLKMGE